MDLDAYLDRIGASAARDVSSDNLRSIQRAHLLHVPFENLDIHLPEPRPIQLDEEALFAKIVTRRRGGYCYELNGLLALALRQLGYEVTLLSGRTKTGVGSYGPEFDHLALLVEADEIRWLVDVGFGHCFFEPLRLDEAEAQSDGRSKYRIDPQPMDHRMLLCLGDDGMWSEQYLFNLVPRELADFEGMNKHHQTSPASHFTRGRVITRATETGRITLSNQNLYIEEPDDKKVQAVNGSKEYYELLRDSFGLDPDDVPGLV